MQILKVPWKYQYSQTVDLPLQGRAPSETQQQKKKKKGEGKTYVSIALSYMKWAEDFTYMIQQQKH